MMIIIAKPYKEGDGEGVNDTVVYGDGDVIALLVERVIQLAEGEEGEMSNGAVSRELAWLQSFGLMPSIDYKNPVNRQE